MEHVSDGTTTHLVASQSPQHPAPNISPLSIPSLKDFPATAAPCGLLGWAGLGWADRKRMYLRLARRRHHTPPAWRPYTLTASMHLLLCSIEVILVTVIILENQTPS